MTLTLKYVEKRIVFLINDVGSTEYTHGKKINLNFCFTPHTKINSRWTEDENISNKTIKLLEDCFHEYRQRVLKCRTKSIGHKGKRKDLLDHSNVNFHVWKNTFNGVEKLAKEWSYIYIYIKYIFNKVFFCIRDRLNTYIYVSLSIYTHTHKVDHWTILTLTVLVHLYVDFFLK